VRATRVVLTAVTLLAVSCAQAPRQSASQPSVAPSGTPSIHNGEFAFLGPNFTGWLVAPDGSGLRPVSLPDATAYIVPWAYSPDGTRIAYTGYERGDAGDYAIYVSNADGSDVTDLTTTYLDPAENNQGGPVWSPDSTQIAFSNDSNDPSTQGVYLMRADGAGIHKIADGGYPAWSPDGQSIVLAAAAGEGNDIYSVSIDGSRLTRLTHTSAIAFEVFVGRSWDIYTVRPDGTGLRPLTNGPGDEIQPAWSPDGSLIAYMASPHGSGGVGDITGTFDVYTSRPDGAERTTVTTGGMGAGGSLAWQPRPNEIQASTS
jgi:Tol biopolymer transport system component